MMPSARPGSGLELAAALHAEVLRPALDAALPGLPYAAALLGDGSEVLGYDTERSRDHDWGPRLQLVVEGDDALRAEVEVVVAGALPAVFRGVRTAYPTTRDPAVRHRVDVLELDGWWDAVLGVPPGRDPTPVEWLGLPWQRLASLTAGVVLHEGPGRLTAARGALTWYPGDVWRVVLAAQWALLGEREHLVGRCSEVGDEDGARVLAAEQVRDLRQLALLLARRWPPYPKWLGTAVAELPDGGGLGAALTGALTAPGPGPREEHLCAAYEVLTRRLNALGLCSEVDPTPRQFHDRPFRVLGADRFATALLAAVTDQRLVGAGRPVGCVDQITASAAVLTDPARCHALVRALRG